MGRREFVRSLVHGVVRNEESSLAPYDTSVNISATIDITVINNNTSSDEDKSIGSNEGPHQLVSTVTAIAGFVFIVAMCVCMKSTRTPEAERRIRRYKRGGYKKKSPKYYRLKQIRKSLTVQQVVQVDKTGQVQLRGVRDTSHVQKDDNDDVDDDNDAEDVSNTSSVALGEDANDSSSSVVSETKSEAMVACCCICLEPYREGDIVAWSNSSSEDCLHVFHRDCIHQWLINPKHNDCPSCRTTILARVSLDSFSDSEEEEDVEGQRRADSNNSDHNIDNAPGSINNSSTTSVAYYIMHGLISRANQVKFSLIGQTISFDSEDSDFDGLYYANNTTRDGGDVPTRSDWLNHPSTFRRAMSFGDRIFSSTFSSTLTKPQQYGAATWKPVLSIDKSNENVHATIRRASTKLITDTKSLQQAHILRRVVSAGPCTPLDNRVDDQIRFLPTTVEDFVESNVRNTSNERLVVPFRRTSSLRHRLFSQDTLSNCDEDEKQRTRTDFESDAMLLNVDNTDSTEEDNILVLKER